MAKKPNNRYIDFGNLFKKQLLAEETLKKACKEISSASGIYFYHRDDVVDGEVMYIGKAKNLLERNVAHLLRSDQHIDFSVRKWGLYHEKTNRIGWKLKVIEAPLDKLDELERYYIEHYMAKGVKLYNVESGGTEGKEIIGERKAGKNYTDGKRYAKAKVWQEVAVFFEKYLDFVIKGKPNKTKERKLQQFAELLKGTTENEQEQ